MDTKKNEEGAQWSGSEFRKGERSSVTIGKAGVREIKFFFFFFFLKSLHMLKFSLKQMEAGEKFFP